MVNYKHIFETKIFFVIKMVDVLGEYRVPLDWFDIAVADNEMSRNDDNTHLPGTILRYRSLLSLYKDEYERLLKACGIIVEEGKSFYKYSLQ